MSTRSRWFAVASLLAVGGCSHADRIRMTPLEVSPTSETATPWITVEIQPLPEQVAAPIREALDAGDCEALLLALPSAPTAWDLIALGRCYSRTGRFALAHDTYQLAGSYRPEPAAAGELLRAQLVGHFEHRLPISITVADLDVIAGEGLRPGVDPLLRVYLDPDRCADRVAPATVDFEADIDAQPNLGGPRPSVWDRWAALEIEVGDPRLRAAIGTLFVECGEWAGGRDHAEAVRLSTSIWPDRGRIALLDHGRERLALARASAYFATRNLKAHDAVMVDPQHHAEIRSLAGVVLHEVPRTSPLFPRALELALTMYLASAAEEQAFALLVELGPSAAADAVIWWIKPEAAAFGDWRPELERSLALLDQLAALGPTMETLTLPDPLRRCIELDECDPALERALGDRAWWIGRVEPDYRLLLELRAVLDAIALDRPPAGFVGADWITAWQIQHAAQVERVSSALLAVIQQRHRKLGGLLDLVTREGVPPAFVDPDPLF